jgi:hypothetical protein
MSQQLRQAMAYAIISALELYAGQLWALTYAPLRGDGKKYDGCWSLRRADPESVLYS